MSDTVTFARNVLAAALFPFVTPAILAQAVEGRACESVEERQLRATLADIEKGLDRLWVKRGPDWHVAYDIAATPKNPFDRNAQSSGAVATHGYAWVRDVTCKITDGDNPNTRVVIYTATAFRFKEDRSKWSEPLQNGTIAAFLLTPDGPQWAIQDKSKDETIFLPEGTMRQLRPDELPQSKAWPDKRCPPPKQWQGTECTAPAAKAATR